MRAARAAALAASVALVALAAPALAQDQGSVPASAIGGGGPNRALQLAQKRPYWSAGHERAFVSGSFETGILYYRPQLALGWGKPHWAWIGGEVQTQIAAGSTWHYGGLRVEAPFGEVRAGARYSFDWSQAFLPRRASYTDETLDEESGAPNARHLLLEAEAAGWVPVGGGALIGSAGVFHMLGVPDDHDVYLQLMNVVVEPPWITRTRAGYVHGFGDDGGLVVGAAVELITVPERDAWIVRTGPQVGVALTHHLDAALSVMAVASSPDALRLEGAEIAQLGFRYRWATGDRFPEFP